VTIHSNMKHLALIQNGSIIETRWAEEPAAVLLQRKGWQEIASADQPVVNKYTHRVEDTGVQLVGGVPTRTWSSVSRPSDETNKLIDSETQQAIIAPLGGSLENLLEAVITQLNMTTEGVQLGRKADKGAASQAEAARLSKLESYAAYVYDCRAHGKARKLNPSMTPAYPEPPVLS